MRRGLLLATVLAAVVAGCGGRGGTAPPPAPGAWRANARQVIAQLRVDLAAVALGGTTRADAAKALRDTSDLYTLLVAYADLGGCRAMAAGTAAPARVVAVLLPACAHAERAAALFTRATQRDEPGALVLATRESARAQPQLIRASLALRR